MVLHKPRLLSDNGASYISGELADWLEDRQMDHVRSAPYQPQGPFAFGPAWPSGCSGTPASDAFAAPSFSLPDPNRKRLRIRRNGIENSFVWRGSGRHQVTTAPAGVSVKEKTLAPVIVSRSEGRISNICLGVPPAAQIVGNSASFRSNTV